MAEENAKIHGIRMFGPADNKAFYETWHSPPSNDKIFDNLFLSSIDLAFTVPFTVPYRDTLLPTMSYLAWYGKHLSIHPKKPVSSANTLAGSWADLMGPFLTPHKTLDKATAQKELCKYVHELIQNESISTVTYANKETFISTSTPTTERGTSVEWDALAANVENAWNVENSIKILKHLATRVRQPFKIIPVNMILNVCSAVLNGYRLSERIADRIINAFLNINNGMIDDEEISDLKINYDACKMFYQVFGRCIDDTNIRNIINKWAGRLCIKLFRLTMDVQKVACYTILIVSVTGKAIRFFIDFDWGRIKKAYSDEWESFLTVVTEIGNNQFYGFKKRQVSCAKI